MPAPDVSAVALFPFGMSEQGENGDGKHKPDRGARHSGADDSAHDAGRELVGGKLHGVTGWTRVAFGPGCPLMNDWPVRAMVSG